MVPVCVPSSFSSYAAVCSSSVTSQQYVPGVTRLRPEVVHVTSNVPLATFATPPLQTGVSKLALLGSFNTAVTKNVPSMPVAAVIVTLSLGLTTGTLAASTLPFGVESVTKL